MLRNIYDWFVNPDKKTNGESKMTNFAHIKPTASGFALYGNSGLIQTYSRERDAKRGATRRGLTVA
jgi:hypothetical protein